MKVLRHTFLGVYYVELLGQIDVSDACRYGSICRHYHLCCLPIISMFSKTAIISILLLSAVVVYAEPLNHSSLLHALYMVESGGRKNPPDGDNGRAIGPYQIWHSYWLDATSFDRSIGGTYQDCRKKAYAEKVVKAYLKKYATRKRLGHKPTDEDRARIHNGGPNGFRKASTLKYWKKVRVYLGIK